MSTRTRNQMCPHLSELEIDEYLIGDLAAAPAAHLAVCNPCQTRVAEMQDPITSFKTVTLAWSERQSATLALTPAGFPRRSWSRRTVLATTAAAALIMGVMAPVAYRQIVPAQKSTVTSALSVASTAIPGREEQIAKDNRMMQAIDRELEVSASSPSEAFGLSITDGHPQNHAHAAQLRD